MKDQHRPLAPELCTRRPRPPHPHPRPTFLASAHGSHAGAPGVDDRHGVNGRLHPVDGVNAGSFGAGHSRWRVGRVDRAQVRVS